MNRIAPKQKSVAQFCVKAWICVFINLTIQTQIIIHMLKTTKIKVIRSALAFVFVFVPLFFSKHVWRLLIKKIVLFLNFKITSWQRKKRRGARACIFDYTRVCAKRWHKSSYLYIWNRNLWSIFFDCVFLFVTIMQILLWIKRQWCSFN